MDYNPNYIKPIQCADGTTAYEYLPLSGSEEIHFQVQGFFIAPLPVAHPKPTPTKPKPTEKKTEDLQLQLF